MYLNSLKKKCCDTHKNKPLFINEKIFLNTDE